MMNRRIITSLAVVMGFAMVVPVATARLSQQDVVSQRLGEVGAWALPTSNQSGPSLTGQRALVRERLQEIGAWAVPSTSTTTQVASSARFNWENLGIGTACALGALLLGVTGVVSIRRHHRPIAH